MWMTVFFFSQTHKTDINIPFSLLHSVPGFFSILLPLFSLPSSGILSQSLVLATDCFAQESGGAKLTRQGILRSAFYLIFLVSVFCFWHYP